MATKVLIVLDGDYRFMTGTMEQPDFTYLTLVNALVGAGMQVTKAHRQTDTDPAALNDFNFAEHDLFQYDVIWLLGHDGRNEDPGSALNSGPVLADDQVAAIARFMEAGGGVFATGDHDSIGCEMCGAIPRVRAMRAWFGEGDTPGGEPSPMPDSFPRNHPRITSGRADTTQRNEDESNYDGDADRVWFENQSDKLPQQIAPDTVPTHPILRWNGEDITVFPDHMHEGLTLGTLPDEEYDYDLTLDFDGDSFVEFPAIAGARETPVVIASGQSLAHTSFTAKGNSAVFDNAPADARPIATLSVYDGRKAGVGRIVTGSTFHHYVDINLTGDSGIDHPDEIARTGPSAQNNHGFNDADDEIFNAIKQVYINITNWLAPPKPAISLILERSTFSQDEANANPDFDGAILVTVDGLKPDQFPGGPIDDLTPSPVDLGNWAPDIVAVEPTGLSFVATGVSSDDPTLPPRLQRFTFTYRVTIADAAFDFDPDDFNTIRIDATLDPPATDPLTDSAFIQLVKSANPFMLDLDDGNETPWLSSDFRIFPVVAGDDLVGVTLPDSASRSEALDFLRDVVGTISVAQFENLPSGQSESALSPFPQTTGGGEKNVYNFGIARVRLSGAGASATDVRVFFRLVPAPTTAALTYHESGGVPSGTYKKTAGAEPIAIPGTNGAGTEWLSFPVFSNTRELPPEDQEDLDNVQNMDPGSDVFFGALIDNNLSDAYLKPTPVSADPAISLPDLMMGEHQCIVAQIEFEGTPIPDGAKPYTSDKLAQRNIAFSAIANPGLDASRMALHTFEIEATPGPITADLPPDEIVLDWRRRQPPEPTEVRLIIPGWDAAEVVALADRFYPRHEIRALDAHTVALPGGGTRYVPIPRGSQRRTGVIVAELPLGVISGQRFDLSVRQVTNRGRAANVPPPRTTKITLAEAAKLLGGPNDPVPGAAPTTVPRGAFDLGGNRTLLTDLSVFDAASDHAMIVEQPDPALVAAARRDSARWRETVGAFQLGIPVTRKSDMLPHHLRLLSVLRWRARWLRPNGRWHATFHRYIELIADKVRALGGDPFSVPATPDGAIPLPGADGGHGDGHGEGDGHGDGGAGHGGPGTHVTHAELFGVLIGALAAAVLLAWMWPIGPLTRMQILAAIAAIAVGIVLGWLIGRWFARRAP